MRWDWVLAAREESVSEPGATGSYCEDRGLWKAQKKSSPTPNTQKVTFWGRWQGTGIPTDYKKKGMSPVGSRSKTLPGLWGRRGLGQ